MSAEWDCQKHNTVNLGECPGCLADEDCYRGTREIIEAADELANVLRSYGYHECGVAPIKEALAAYEKVRSQTH